MVCEARVKGFRKKMDCETKSDFLSCVYVAKVLYAQPFFVDFCVLFMFFPIFYL